MRLKDETGGVPWVPMGEVGTFVRGNGMQKSDLTDAGMPAIHYGQVHTHYRTWTATTKSFVTPEFGQRLRKAQSGNLVIATTSEDDDALGKAVAWLGDEAVAVSGDACIYRHSLDPRYVAYYFQTPQFHDQKKPGVTGTKVRRISCESLARIKIPVPPVEVQRRIVASLDLFTALQAELAVELEVELEARQRQYAHYRDALFSIKDEAGGVPWVPMGEVGTFVRGNGMQKSDLIDVGMPAIHYGQVHTHYRTWTATTNSFVPPEFGQRLRKAQSGNLVIATTSEDDDAVGKAVAWLGDEAVAVSGDACIYRHSLDPRYVAYYFQTPQFHDQKKPSVTGTKVRRISGESLAKIKIPVPPIEDQRRIVAILDRFDRLANDLSTGLPAEIKARRQQYEYYRDKLYAFEETA